MLAVTIPVNIVVLGILVLGSFLVGFLLRSSQIKKNRKKVLELENEMLSNHADILQLQKEKTILEQKLKEHHIPVIPLNLSKDENSGNKVTDLNLRKMSQQAGIAKHSR